MKLKSIYEHMENATKNIPENANFKVFKMINGQWCLKEWFSGEIEKIFIVHGEIK